MDLFLVEDLKAPFSYVSSDINGLVYDYKYFCFFTGYSCALVGDILLQGHLYITENYFAFYSNVFGYITKVSKVKVIV